MFSDDPFSGTPDQTPDLSVYKNEDSSDQNLYNKQTIDHQSTDTVRSDDKDITVKEYFDEYVLPVHSKKGYYNKTKTFVML